MGDGILLVPVPSQIMGDSRELNQREEQKVSHLMLCVCYGPYQFYEIGLLEENT